LSKLVGEEIAVEPCVSSSFIVKQKDPLLDGLNNAGLYFSEDDDWQQMSYGLTGKFVTRSKNRIGSVPGELAQMELPR